MKWRGLRALNFEPWIRQVDHTSPPPQSSARNSRNFHNLQNLFRNLTCPAPLPPVSFSLKS